MLLVWRAARCPAGPAFGSAHRPQPDPESKAGSADHHHGSREVQVEAAGLQLGRWAGRVRGKSARGPIAATHLGRGQPAVLSRRRGPVCWRCADDASITRCGGARALRALRRRLRAFPDPHLVPLQAPGIGSVSIFISQRGDEAGRWKDMLLPIVSVRQSWGVGVHSPAVTLLCH